MHKEEKNKYFLDFEKYKNKTIGEFIEILKETPGIPLNELKIKDLTYSTYGGIQNAHGVYIFKEKEQIILVGKAETVSFTERIGGHFDLRPNAWFNRLLFVIARKEGLDKETRKTVDEGTKIEYYEKAWRYAFENCSLILVNMEQFYQIDKLETALRKTAEPFNKLKEKGDKTLILKDIVKINKKGILKYIDIRLIQFQKQFKEDNDGEYADFISDCIIFEIEAEIAVYAISVGYQATISGFSLEELIYTEDLEYEDGTDVHTPDFIGEWIATLSGWYVENPNVQEQTPNNDVLEVVMYYDKKLKEIYNLLNSEE